MSDSTIKLPIRIKKKLKKLKLHENEAYWGVVERLIKAFSQGKTRKKAKTTPA